MAYYFVESESNPLRHITRGLPNMRAEMGWLSNGGLERLGEESVEEILPFGAICLEQSCPGCLQAETMRRLGNIPTWLGVRKTSVETVWHHVELLKKGAGHESMTHCGH